MICTKCTAGDALVVTREGRQIIVGYRSSGSAEQRQDKTRLTINDQDAECAVVATDALEDRKSIC